MKLKCDTIYLDTLERENCKKLWADFEYDFDFPAETFNPGHSVEKADGWFDEIQKLQGNSNVRLGIFLDNGTCIGDVALQDIDRENRKCTIGMGIAKIENRSKGYGQQAVKLMLEYGFRFLGLQRISANTLDINKGGQKSLEKCGFTLEGIERNSVYLNGEMHNRFCYSILKDEFYNNAEKFFLINNKK